MRRDLSALGHLARRRFVAALLGLAMACAAIGAAAVPVAVAGPSQPASAGLYKLGLRVPGSRFVGSGTENPIAVDRHGVAYVFTATRTQQGGFPSDEAARVTELSPRGRTIRSFSTTFRVHGQKRYLDVNGLAVTPGGHDVLVAGNVSADPNDLTNSHPYLAEYSGSTGVFITGYGFDTNQTRYAAGVAVDPTARHVYVGDERNEFIGAPTSRVYEFDVPGLNQINDVRIPGNELCCTLAVAPDGNLFAAVGPPHSTAVLIQEFSATLAFKNQFASPPTGMAIGPTGDIFAGSRAKRLIERLSSKGHLLETLGSGHFSGFPVAGAVTTSGDVYAIDEAKNGVAIILRFDPVTPQTTITSHPTTPLAVPTATFKFKSSIHGAKLECRLQRPGAAAPPFRSCSSPAAYSALPDGSYTFQARSISPAGPADPSPASAHFNVKLPVPDTTITAAPASTIGVASATFAFTSASAGATFGCRLELVGASGVAFTPCKSPDLVTAPSDGTWQFEVRATSTLGVTDPTPATAQFTVDTVPPTVTAPLAPSIPIGEQLQPDGTLGLLESWSGTDTYSPSSALMFTVQQSAGAAASSLGPFTPIPSFQNLTGITSGTIPISPADPVHELRVEAENQLGVSADGPPGAAFQLSVIDNADARLTYTTGWTVTTDAGAFDGKVRTTSNVGQTASMTFSGRAVAIIAPVGPSSGSLNVCIDSNPATGAGCTTVSLRAAAAAERQVVYVKAALATGMHTLQVSDASGSVALDAVAVLG